MNHPCLPQITTTTALHRFLPTQMRAVPSRPACCPTGWTREMALLRARIRTGPATIPSRAVTAKQYPSPQIWRHISNLETMELNEICPSQPHIPYSIAVCSSPNRRDIKVWPYGIGPSYVLPNSQRSEITHWKFERHSRFQSLRSQKTNDGRNHLVTVGVLLSCFYPRLAFCCEKFTEGFWESPPMYQPNGPEVSLHDINGWHLITNVSLATPWRLW